MTLADALVDELLADAAALDRIAEALGPRIAGHAKPRDAPLTTREAAEHATVHERTIRRALAAGTLRGRTVAGRWRIAREDVAAWLDAGAPTSATVTHSNGRPRARTAGRGADAIAGRAPRLTHGGAQDSVPTGPVSSVPRPARRPKTRELLAAGEARNGA